MWTRLDAGPGSDAITVGLLGTPHDATVTLGSLTIGGTDHPGRSPPTVCALRGRRVVATPWMGSSRPGWSGGPGDLVCMVMRAWELRQRPLIDPRVHARRRRGRTSQPDARSVIAVAVEDGSEVAAGDPVVP